MFLESKQNVFQSQKNRLRKKADKYLILRRAIVSYSTGLQTNDETCLKNVYWIFPYAFLGSSYSKSFRSILQSHPFCVTLMFEQRYVRPIELI